jgi:hypothetical protein
MHVYDLSILWGIERNCGTLFSDGVVVSEEWAEDGALCSYSCGFRSFLVRDLIDQTGITSTTDRKKEKRDRLTIPALPHRTPIGLHFVFRCSFDLPS